MLGIAAPRARCMYLGTLKSFSQEAVAGYGFIQCDELFLLYNRDTFVDRAVLEGSTWRVGVLVEFSVTLNLKGQPQARDVVWEPVAMLPSSALAAQPGPRAFSAEVMKHLKELIGWLNEKAKASALFRAADFHDKHIDYMFFVLDRLGDDVAMDAVAGLSDTQRQVVLQRIAEMLNERYADERCKSLTQWLKALDCATLNDTGR
mmetsp:Transcript_173092/g.549551  ORF Transcript_173092/g.549551 Transcript_173092/m.549551 type:complete len:204 (+) Transcript_173092:161-772(+)